MGPETSGFDLARTASVRGAAYAALLVERVWPVVVRLAALLGLFLVLAWFGVFAAVHDWLRIGLLGLLALGTLLVLWRARRLRLPTRAEVARRVEADSALRHQPLQAQEDRVPAADDFAAALWREHQRRMAERLRGLKASGPQTRTYAIDPYGLRAVVALLVVTGFAFSFGPGGGRIADAVAPFHTELVAGVRVDAWATPPGYTGRAPVLLSADAATAAPIEVPQGTVLSLRVSDRRGADVTFRPDGGEAAPIAPVVPEGQAAAEGSAEAGETPVAGEYELPLRGSGTARIATTFRELGAWTFAVTPDTPPTVAFRGEPKPGRNGSLDLAFAVTDDYGVAGGEAKLATREPVAPGARPLVAPPEPSLSLPRRRAGEAEGRTSLALADSPYAGTRAALTLVVRDDAGQVGETAPQEITLPERRFTDSLARAVVEQRRILALDANAAPRVVDMLDAVTLRGDEFIANPSHYLALRAVRERIAHAPDDPTLLSAVDFLWEIAVGIEDGDLGATERRLRDLQEQLSEAIENGASEEEIARLMQELRQAMQEYMQAMAEAMRNMPPQSLSQMGEAQEIRPQDLDRMLDRIEDLARSGSKDAAQQLLSELREMMDSLQAMRPSQGQQQSGQQSPMQQQMNQLGEMLQRQQKLMDETFELGRQQMRRQMEGEQGEMGQEGQEGQQGSRPPMSEEELRAMQERLQAEQGQLQKDLQALQEAMRGQGMQPSDDLGQAGESMGRAEGALGQGDDGEAVGQQGEAMSALRRGAQDAMRQMQAMQGQGQGEGQQPGQGQQPGGPGLYGEGPGQQRSGRDPLGRERQTQGPDFGQDVGVPDEIDIQRARRILDQIRDRLGRQLSPEQEREYLERLLRTP